MRKTLLLIAALGLSLAFAQDYIFGINFDAGGKFDRSFNEGTWRGMERAISELEASEGLEIELLEFEGTPATFTQGLRTMPAQGAELLVAPGFSQADAIHNSMSREFPDTFFVNIDGAPPEGEEANPNVKYVRFREHEGSFLVGYLAGKLTQTGTVGFVGGMDIPLIHAFDLGYQEGVKAACPDCKVISNYVGVTPEAWNNPARAKELATVQQAQGADIIYAAAGASGNGVIDFVNEKMCYTADNLRETPLASQLAGLPVSDAYASACGEGSQPLFFIGVDRNQNYLGDTDNNPETLNHGLTSMLKRVDVAGYNAVTDYVNDTLTGGVVETLGLAEEGVGYALDEYNKALIPAEVLEEVENVKQQIISGDITVTDYREQ